MYFIYEMWYFSIGEKDLIGKYELLLVHIRHTIFGS